MIKKSILFRLLCLLLCGALLSGCATLRELVPGRDTYRDYPIAGNTAPSEDTAPTEPGPTAPPDGDPNDITCKGSYFGSVNAGVTVAWAGEYTLTAGMLNVLYNLEVGSYRDSGKAQPDYSQGLDTQMCTVRDQEKLTWQQYFLRTALSRWHSCVALMEASKTATMPLDPEYAPFPRTHADFLREDLPMIEDLYGWDTGYRVNEMHQDFIDGLPQLVSSLEGVEQLQGSLEDLVAVGQVLNYAYSYLNYELFHRGPTDEELAQRAGAIVPGDTTVTFRHILLTGADADRKAQELLKAAQAKGQDEYDFAVLANTHSQDTGTQVSGGLYDHIAPGQLVQELDAWLFDPARTPGESAIVKSGLGTHVVWFRGLDDGTAQAERELNAEKRRSLVDSARAALPISISYSAITLAQTELTQVPALEEILYPDIAHENITTVPVYLQQDYPYSDYGAFSLVGYGCGVTTLAMFASYMADEYLTPPVLADRYGHYCHINGTDTKLMIDSAPELGYFMYDWYYDWNYAKAAMEDGMMVISLQLKGPFTSGGHYLVLRNLWEDGTVGICDSNIYNYGDVRDHKTNHFTWSMISQAGAMYWAYQPKITHIDACGRCGDAPAPEGLLNFSYTCPKCRQALDRRADFVTFTGIA